MWREDPTHSLCKYALPITCFQQPPSEKWGQSDSSISKTWNIPLKHNNITLLAK
jgi:hypothetical protein